MGHSVDFRIVARDFASRKFREVGDAAAWMAAKVVAADKAMDGAFDSSRAKMWFNAILMGASLVPPAMAAIVGALGAVNSAFVSMLPGAGALGLVVGGMFKDFAKNDQALKTAQDAVASATSHKAKMKALANLHAVQQTVYAGAEGKAYKGFQNTKTAFTQYKAQAAPSVAPMLLSGFKDAQMLLPKLQPLVKSFADVATQALQKLGHVIQGPWFANFLTWAQQVGRVNFQNLLHALGEFGRMIANLAMAFSKEGVGIVEWLDKIATKGAQWSENLKGSPKFEAFLAYVHQNAPLVAQLLGNLATVVVHLVQGLAGFGSLNLRGLVMLSDFLAKVNPHILGAVAIGLAGLNVATQVAAGFKALKAAMAGFMALQSVYLAKELLVAVATRDWAAAMAVLDLALDANPVGILVVAIGALVAAFIYAYKHSETFRSIVNATMHAIGAAAQWLWGKIKVAADYIAHTAWPMILKGAQQMWHGIETAAHAIGRVFSWLWNNGIRPVVTFILRGFAFLLDGWAKVLHALGHIPHFGWATAAGNAMQIAANKARNLAAAINAIHSKSVTVRTNFTEYHSIHTTRYNSTVVRQGQLIQTTHARGGRPGVGKWTLVGEEGPEYFRTDVPGSIVPAKATKSMRGGEEGGDLGTITLVLQGEDGRTLQKKLLTLKRNNGGLSLGLS